jgi:MFS family permease
MAILSVMTSLWRNRDFNLLWISQSFSDLGVAVSSLAVPLLVLALTGSPVQAGLVGTVVLLTRMVCRLPAGVLADRVNRRRAMIICDLIRLTVLLGLAAAVVTDRATVPLIIAVAVVDSAGGTFVSTVAHSALRSIMPAGQVSDAVARNEARTYAAGLAGPPLGGLLFGLAHALPFGANAITYLASLIGVTLIRKPLQAERTEEPAGAGAALAEGVRFVFADPFLRAVLLIAAPLYFALTGVTFTIILNLQRHGTEPAVIGLVETIIGVGGLTGAIVAPALQRALPLASLVRAICWAGVGLVGLGALFTSSIAAAVPVALAVFLGPACNAALLGYQAAITPDRLQGRVVSVVFLAATSASAAAPILAGVFVTIWGGAGAMLFFAAAVGLSAVAATIGKGLRTVRPIDEHTVAA